MIRSAMWRWQLSASAVTMQPSSDSIARSLGTAVISLDFASTAIWPRTNRCSPPQALTMCSGEPAEARSNERRKVLPSTAITP